MMRFTSGEQSWYNLEDVKFGPNNIEVRFSSGEPYGRNSVSSQASAGVLSLYFKLNTHKN